MMSVELSRLESMVLSAIQSGGDQGSTCDEIEALTDLPHQTASARIHGLLHKGVIMDSGQIRTTRSGRRAIVWKPHRNAPTVPQLSSYRPTLAAPAPEEEVTVEAPLDVAAAVRVICGQMRGLRSHVLKPGRTSILIQNGLGSNFLPDECVRGLVALLDLGQQLGV